MVGQRALWVAAGAAACVAVLCGMRQPGGEQVAARSGDAGLLAELDANTRLQRQQVERLKLRYEAGRLSQKDLTRGTIGVLEAEILALTVRGDHAGVVERLREVVRVQRELLDGARAHAKADPGEPDPAEEARLSQELAEASVRLWEAERRAK